MNRATIIGNITHDLELKTSGGGSFLNFTVVTSKRWTDRKTEEKKEDKQFHKIVAFGRNAEIVNQYFSKGDKIFIEGTIKYESYQNKDGVKMTATKIYMDRFEFMNNNKNRDNNNNEEHQEVENKPVQKNNKQNYKNQSNQSNQSTQNNYRPKNQGSQTNHYGNKNNSKASSHPNYNVDNEDYSDEADDKIPF